MKSKFWIDYKPKYRIVEYSYLFLSVIFFWNIRLMNKELSRKFNSIGGSDDLEKAAAMLTYLNKMGMLYYLSAIFLVIFGVVFSIYLSYRYNSESENPKEWFYFSIINFGVVISILITLGNIYLWGIFIFILLPAFFVIHFTFRHRRV